MRIIADSLQMQTGNQALYVMPNSPYETVPALAKDHASVAINSANNIAQVLLGSLFSADGLKLNTIHQVVQPAFPLTPGLLAAHKFDAAWLPEPFGTEATMTALRDGEVPEDVIALFADGQRTLLPASYSELRHLCECPDHRPEQACKHVVAVCMALAQACCRRPEALLILRGGSVPRLLSAADEPARGRSEAVSDPTPAPAPDPAPSNPRPPAARRIPPRSNTPWATWISTSATPGSPPTTKYPKRCRPTL